jgi:integrase
VALSALAVSELWRWKAAQNQLRLRAGPAWREGEFVFTRPDGRPLEGGRVTELFKRDLAAAGLPMIKYHSLRHTAATLLLQAGTHPKVVQEMLGHATIALTMDIYSHVLPHMHQAAAGTFDQLLLNSPENAREVLG